MVKVSVILPSLNVVPYIRQCVESVMGQTLQEIEILCIDAGSTDGTREILAECAERDARIRLIDSPIKSYGYQVNLGIREARGEYVGIVETDDYILPEMFAHLYELAHSNHTDMAMVDSIFIHEDTGEQEENHIFKDAKKKFYFQVIKNDDLLQTHMLDYFLWDGIYRREFLLQRNVHCNESRGAAFQDIGFLQQVQTLSNSCIYSNHMLYCYRYGREGSSSKNSGWLGHVRNEWEFLFNGNLPEQSEWQVHSGAVYARMVESFITHVRKSLLATDFQFENVSWRIDYDVLIRYVKQAVEQEKIDWNILGEGLCRALWLMFESLDAYRSEILLVQYQEKFKKVVREKILHWADDGCYIFGAGIRGRRVASFLHKHGKQVLGFIDNNDSLWGEEVEDVKVYSPQEIVELPDDCSIIVCNRLHADEICVQLYQMGISWKRVHNYV